MKAMARAFAAFGLTTAITLGATPLTAFAAPPSDWATQLWDAARNADNDRFNRLLGEFPEAADGEPAYPRLKESVDSLVKSFENQQAKRTEEIAEVRKEFDELLAGDLDDRALSKALGDAVRLELLSHNHDEIVRDPQVALIIEKAEAAAHAAEARADWFTANELFFRLNALMEAEATYKDDLTRVERRLGMLRLYTPRRLWELRDERARAEAEAEGEEPEELPPYNPTGDDFREKLSGIDAKMVRTAIWQAADRNVDQKPMRDLLVSALDSIEMMLTTKDLDETFTGLENGEAREQMLSFIDSRRTTIRTGRNEPTPGDMANLLDDLMSLNDKTVHIPQTAILHEFGNGAMGALDQFSAIIWPDEWARFERNTRGSFIGVGIQIQLDEKQRIKVVTPLDGTPAQRAGMLKDDVITKIDGKPTWGFTLDQAVDVITGPENTKVALTVERAVEDGEPAEKTFDITRKPIDLVTVKGWRRAGEAEDDWDWFIDPETEIGYIRLTNFDERTAINFDRAIGQMRKDGITGLILDLRYNPGGLLDQAVEIANRFIDVNDGVIVSTHYAGPQGGTTYERAVGRKGKLAGLPTIVLVNEGSASASEIVAGAIKHYADEGQINAIVLGARSYGKGSVQNVWRVTMPPTKAAVKITTQHYHLPDGQMIHRQPGSAIWGVNPNFTVDMLPKQIAETLTIRRNADLFNVEPISFEDNPATDDPDAMLEGPDVQLQTALVLLQARVLSGSQDQAMLDLQPLAPGGG